MPLALALASAKIDHPQFHFVDNWDVFCSTENCSPVIGGIPACIDKISPTA